MKQMFLYEAHPIQKFRRTACTKCYVLAHPLSVCMIYFLSSFQQLLQLWSRIFTMTNNCTKEVGVPRPTTVQFFSEFGSWQKMHLREWPTLHGGSWGVWTKDAFVIQGHHKEQTAGYNMLWGMQASVVPGRHKLICGRHDLSKEARKELQIKAETKEVSLIRLVIGSRYL